MKTEIQKKFSVAQPIDLVWASLSDPTDVVTCVPGASITEKIDEHNYKGAVLAKFGPIKASYTGDIEILELDEVNKKMVLSGKGLDSKGKGSADMKMVGNLSESNGLTNVEFNIDITIIGKLAQFGSRLINDVSDQLLNQFVANFKAKFPEQVQTQTSTSSTNTNEVLNEGQQTASAPPVSSAENQHTNAIETEPVEKVGFFRRILNWILSKMFSS